MLAPTALPVSQSAPRDVTVAVIDDVREFDRLRGEWNGLLEASAAATPFLTWSWLRSWWTHFGGAATLRLLVVRDRGELIGLAPMMLSRRGLQQSPALEFLGLGGAGSDYLDAIVRPGDERAVVDALTSALH